MKRSSPLQFSLCLFLAAASARPALAGSPRELASRMFQRLTGYTLPLTDPRRVQMETKIVQGKFAEAAAIATTDPAFINFVVRQWAMPMSNLEGSRRKRLNDFVSTIMGAVRDNLDSRVLLSDDMVYVVDVNHPEIVSLAIQPWDEAKSDVNIHFYAVDAARINVQKYLVRVPQRTGVDFMPPTPSTYSSLGASAAGLLTTHTWGEAHLIAGTNRRAIAYAFKEFLCRPIETLSDTTVVDTRVRRDVDRTPGGLAATYQNSCRGCHAGLDALSGAYAYFHYANRLRWSSAVQPKMNQNGTFATTYVTTDDSWINYWTQNGNASIGWSSTVPKSGSGLRTLGQMLANSEAFAGCFAQRTYREICGPYLSSDTSVANAINALKNGFKTSGYNLRTLFEQTAAHPSCLGR